MSPSVPDARLRPNCGKLELQQKLLRNAFNVLPTRTPCNVARALPNNRAAGAADDDVNAASLFRRRLLYTAVLTLPLIADVSKSDALDGNPFGYKKEIAKRRRKIPVEEYTDGPFGLKYYDLAEGAGPTAVVGSRVAVHFDVKFRNITFMTSRVGMGVTGGTPFGFDVGQDPGEPGSIGIKGIDLGVRGMHVGGLRKLIIPPELGYGSKGIGEIPPNATLDVDIELLSIKTNPLGYRTKLIEG